MNRLLVTLMFVIMLALSFVGMSQQNIGYMMESNESSTWISRIKHIFGYKPSMGTVTLAEKAKPKARKVVKEETSSDTEKEYVKKVCANGDKDNCYEVPDPNGSDAKIIVSFPADKSKKAKVAVYDPTSSEAKECLECSAKTYDYPLLDDVPKAVADLEKLEKQIAAVEIDRFKNDQAIAAKAKDDKDKVDKSDDETDADVTADELKDSKDDADEAIMACRAKKVVMNKKKTKYLAKGTLSGLAKIKCLTKNADKYKIDSGDDKESQAAAEIQKALLNERVAFLNKGDASPAEKAVWDRYFDKHSDDPTIAQLNYDAWSQHMLTAYGTGDLQQALNLYNMKTPQATVQAAQIVQAASQRLIQNPQAAYSFQADMDKFKEAQRNYGDNLPDSGATSSELANAAMIAKMGNPQSTLNQLNSLNTLVVKQMRAQGIDPNTGTIDTTLAANSTANALVAQSLRNSGLNFCVGTDCVRGADFRGDARIGDGALLNTWNPSAYTLDPGNPSMNLARQVAGLNSGLNTGGVNSALNPVNPAVNSLPWSVGRGGSNFRQF